MSDSPRPAGPLRGPADLPAKRGGESPADLPAKRESKSEMLAPGMRRTAQRTMVYNTIVRLGGHCTADEITVELQKTSARFPRSTVYRSLEALTASGSVYPAHPAARPTHHHPAT